MHSPPPSPPEPVLPPPHPVPPGGAGPRSGNPLTARPWRTVAIAVAAVLLAFVAGYGAAVAYAGTQVPRGTRVLGIDIGGLDERAAVRRLDREVTVRSARPLPIRAGGREVSLLPAKAGLSVDAQATVDRALEGRFGPVSVLGALFGGRDIAPAVRVDRTRLAAALTGVNRRIGTLPREGRIRFRGTKPKVVLPKAGKGLALARVADPIRGAYLRALAGDAAPLDLTIGALAPKTGAQAVRQAAAGPARTAVSGPITLWIKKGQVKDERFSLQPKHYAPHLTFESDGAGGMRPRVDGGKLAKSAASRVRKVERPARDATFKIKSGRPTVVPAREGRKVGPEALGDAVAKAAVSTRDRRATVALVIDRPELTTKKARALGVREKISTFTTRYTPGPPRVTNIQTIADILDGHLVMPGRTFSLNGVVGKRDKARGFVPAPMILNGRYVDSVGGGISQFATTMFNAVFFGGLQDVQHTPHSFYISRYPAGRESTVSFPQPDFRWKNDSKYAVLVDTSYTDSSLTVTFWSTKRYEIDSKSSGKYAIREFESKTSDKPNCIPMPGANGFQVDVWRIFKKDGKVVRRQKFHTTYLPEVRLTCE